MRAGPMLAVDAGAHDVPQRRPRPHRALVEPPQRNRLDAAPSRARVPMRPEMRARFLVPWQRVGAGRGQRQHARQAAVGEQVLQQPHALVAHPDADVAGAVAALARPRQRARIERAPAARTRRLRATDVADRQRPATTGAAAILRHDFLSRPKTNPVPKMKSPARRRLQPVARFLLRGAAAAVLRRSAPSASYTAAPCLLFASQRHLLARRSPENSGPSVSARVQGHPGDSPATTGQFAPCRQSRLHAPAWIRTRV